MNNQERYLKERNNLYEMYKMMYLTIQKKKDEEKAESWAENMASRFDEYCNEAYEKAKSQLNGVPQKSYFLEQFPIGVKSKSEPIVDLEFEEGSDLELFYKDQQVKIKRQAMSFIDGVVGRAALEKPELVADMFGVDLTEFKENPSEDSLNN
ncbi:hypothetical protein [Paenibacillus glucanolyticus]|uniref:hypothetical protein n=1 Tax=Paenibacillus glucanolyticus TaxID=59843 RepID=UPI00096C352B|nr:hypothetical protein [Paenibacillus glucanolyticus]OMF76740.1 hypothetical protein BK142_14565 [Paenibacillus glucanolyticus]